MTDQNDEKLREIAEIIARAINETYHGPVCASDDAPYGAAKAILSLLLSDKAALEADHAENFANKIVMSLEAFSELETRALSAEARATASEAERDGLRAALEDVLRLADLGFEESMKEPEENGNFAAYERARSALAALKETSDAG